MGEQRQIELYAHFVTGVTAGKLFWPRSQTDLDVWFTILVCQDYGEGIVAGGDFAFASVGNILKCKHGYSVIDKEVRNHWKIKLSMKSYF